MISDAEHHLKLLTEKSVHNFFGSYIALRRKKDDTDRKELNKI